MQVLFTVYNPKHRRADLQRQQCRWPKACAQQRSLNERSDQNYAGGRRCTSAMKEVQIGFAYRDQTTCSTKLCPRPLPRTSKRPRRVSVGPTSATRRTLYMRWVKIANSRGNRLTSALPLTTDIGPCARQVRKVPSRLMHRSNALIRSHRRRARGG